MGGGSSKIDKHVLHHHRPKDNRLWMYMPNQELFKCYSVFKGNHPLFFGGLETVMVPDLGAVFVIGGIWADHNLVMELVEKHKPDTPGGGAHFESFQPIIDVGCSNLGTGKRNRQVLLRVRQGKPQLCDLAAGQRRPAAHQPDR